jgi:sulfide:quinone oxidoreductase
MVYREFALTNITILGSGFGALTTVRQLRRQGVNCDITVISPRDELHYLPSSIWLPADLRSGNELKIPLSNFFAAQRVNHVKASVIGLAEGGRLVLTDGGDYRNDQLVVATGGRFIRKLPGIEHALVPCEGIAVAEEIARRLKAMDGGTIAVGFATNPNEQGAVRGGPMFEFLFIIDSLLRRQGRRDRFKLVFFNPSTRPGQRLGDKAVDGLLKEMGRRGIETRLGHKMVRLEADKVVTEGGEFAADLILFMPGLTGPAWLADADLPLSPGGMIAADEKCRIKDRDDLWVVGDSGSFPGPDWLPKQAHQADLQAKAAAENIAAVLKGRAPTTDFKPELICIVDMLDSAMLVYRSETRSFLGPKMKIFHWLKRYFEGHYLRAYR